MEMNRMIHAGLWIVPLLTGLLSASCQKDEVDTFASPGRYVGFAVSESADWNDGSAAERNSAAKQPVMQTTGVLTLRGDDPADSLFLHVSTAKGIETTVLDTLDVTDGETPQTRATPVEKIEEHGSFGVLGYAYQNSWANTDVAPTPEYMYNVEVKSPDWTTSYRWPGFGFKTAFFAYAPYNLPGLVLPEKTDAWAPNFRYTVPEKVSEQQDLLFAAILDVDGNGSAPAALNFSHALTAVKFVTSGDVLGGRISEIRIVGVHNEGTYAFKGPRWEDLKGSATYTLSLDSKVEGGQPNQPITAPEATFMMLPQTLPDDARVEIVFRDDLTGVTNDLSASLKGHTWGQGQTVTYRISTSGINVESTFSVKAPEDFSYEGGSQQYSITSYGTVSRPGTSGMVTALAWKAEFVDDNGKAISKPDWITSFTAEGNGGPQESTFTLVVAASEGIYDNPADKKLQEAEPVGMGKDPYELPTRGGTVPGETANCYIVNAPGRYLLWLAYGNGVKENTKGDGHHNSNAYHWLNFPEEHQKYGAEGHFKNAHGKFITTPWIVNNEGPKPQDCVLIWQDEPNLVTNVRLEGENLIFEVPQNSIKQGNAVVAVRGAGGTILWSWHIWVTPYKLGTEGYEGYWSVKTPTGEWYHGAKYNLGWCDGGQINHAARSVKVRFTQEVTGVSKEITVQQQAATLQQPGNCTYYQYGRKDPMPPAVWDGSKLVDKKIYWGDGYGFKVDGNSQEYYKPANYPYIFYANDDGHWTKHDLKHYWNIFLHYRGHKSDNVSTNKGKTIFDPSPAGYCVPPGNFFRNATYDGNAHKVEKEAKKEEKGRLWKSGVFNSWYTDWKQVEENHGIEFWSYQMLGPGQHDNSNGSYFLPTVGIRGIDGKPGGYERMWYWVANTNGAWNGMGVEIVEEGINPQAPFSNGHALPIRPMRVQ